MYAVIETGGKQYKVEEGDVISVEKLKVAAGEKVTLDKVLLISDGTTVEVGTPYLESAKVEATAVENGKGEKVIIFKYKSKKDYRKKQGHRQPYTMLKIESLGGKSTTAKKSDAVADETVKPDSDKPAEEKKPAAKKAVKSQEKKDTAEKKPAAKKTAKPAEKKEETEK